MRGLKYYKLRDTTFDLYTEQERLPWYYKFLSIFSTWLILAGYILFSIAYTSIGAGLRISGTALTVIASAGLILGYLSDAALAYLSHSLIFMFDGVLIPVLTASAVGVFSTLVHRLLVGEPHSSNAIYLIIPLAASSLGTFVCGIASFFVYMKLRKIKERDARRRVHIPLESQLSPMISNNVSREMRDLVPDDEAQRMQLMALLMAKDERRRDGSVDGGSTYRIDLPGEATSRPRSGSVPSQRSGHSGGRFSVPSFIGRDKNETFKDPRERRREQIEQSGLITHTGSAPNSAGLSPTWLGHGHGQGQGSSQWTSPPLGSGARYG